MTLENFAHEVPIRFESVSGPTDELRARLLSITTTPAPQMRLRHRLALGACAIPASIAVALIGRYALFGRSPLRVDLDSLPFAHAVLELAVLGILTVGATIVATRPGRSGLGSAARLLGTVSLLVTPVFLASAILFPLRSADPGSVAAAARLHPWGLPCLVITAIVGTVALGALSLGLRHAVPVAARLRGAALGAASGAWGAFALVIHCPGFALPHVLASHVAPIAVFTILGALAAPRLLRP